VNGLQSLLARPQVKDLKSYQRSLYHLGLGRYGWFRRWCGGTWIRAYQPLIPGIPEGPWIRVCLTALGQSIAHHAALPLTDLETHLPSAKVVRR
jgi:hypothetical protein